MDKYSQTIDILLSKMIEGRVPFDLVELKDKVKNNLDWRWFDDFTWSEQEQKEFIDWAIEIVRKRHYYNKAWATKEVGWFILRWGLKVK
jgi:hypothetical protein